MLARDLISASVTTVRPQATIGESARLMLENNVSRPLALAEQGQLVGMLPPTDFGLHPQFRPLNNNIYSRFGSSTSPKHTLEVSQKVSSKLVKDVMQLLLDHNINRLQIVEGGKLVGVITRHGFLKQIASG